MKRITALILCLLLAISLTPAARADVTADGYTTISTVEELKAITAGNEAKYRLVADIDMAGADWLPLPFSGELDGNGYTIYNLHVTQTGADTAESVDGNNKTYDTHFAGLFSVVKDAKIHDLTILGADVEIESDEHCYAAILAGYMENTEIRSCAVSGRVKLYTTNAMVGVGGVAGFGSGIINGCTADVELLIADRSEALRCEQFVGGLLACGNADLTNNAVTIDAYASCRGYAHNGGLVGMYYRYNDRPIGSITGNSVDGTITFYEDNPDRRAYCEAFGGELLSFPAEMTGNTQTFTRNEVTAEKGELSPESCEEPAYAGDITPPGCDTWGYTSHICGGCGYEYRDSYTAPAHTPGQWEIVKDATYTEEGEKRLPCTVCDASIETAIIPPHVAGPWEITQEPSYTETGLQQRYCTDCGVLLEEEELPMLVGVSAIHLKETELTLRKGESYTITVEAIEPANAYDTTVTWKSSDINIASPDPVTGEIRAMEKGETVITCVSNDGFASAEIPVTVRYTAGQWCRQYILFGWLWDK